MAKLWRKFIFEFLKQEKRAPKTSSFSLVPPGRVELPRPYGQQILSLLLYGFFAFRFFPKVANFYLFSKEFLLFINLICSH